MVLLAGTLALAGCLGEDRPGSEDPGEDAPEDPAPAEAHVREDGRLEVRVPVPVLVAGFEDDVADGLDERLGEETVDHAYGSWPRNAPPADPTDPSPPAKLHLLGTAGWDWFPMPIVPVADYRVHEADPELEARLATAIEDARSGDTVEANPVEDALAEALPEHGVPVREDAPTLVLMHAAALTDKPKGEHDWTYRLPGGPLEQVRVFGEREPVLALDASAAPDPWSFNPSEEAPPYGTPRNASGDQAVDALAQAAHDATHLRLLQGTFYRIEPAPCHAVTVLMADRPREPSAGRPDPTEHVDPAHLEAELDNITGPAPVHVDAKVLHLPEDDPALAEATRGSYAERDGARAYFDENWDDYWVAREGCEAYLMFAAATHDGDFEAVATYGEDEDRRLGLAAIPGTWSSNADTMRRIVLHEVGHLVGPAHPHSWTEWDENWTYPEGPEEGGFTSRWSSIWSAASYQTGAGFEGGETVGTEFGVQDRANTLRAHVGFAWQALPEDARSDDPRVQAALDRVEALDWAGALERLTEAAQDHRDEAAG